eukprot:jgi/Mesen1/5734/ME000029S05042
MPSKLVTVRGSIVRASVVNPLVKAMHFTCSRCGITVTKHFADSQYSPPTSCSSGGCRSAKFTPSKTSVQSIDLQKVRLQEILDDDIGQEGRVPRVIDCELTEDLVNACLPGDVVTVCGIVKVMNTDADGGAGKAKNKNLFHLYVDAKSVTNAKLHQEEGSQLAPAGAATPPPLSSAPPNAQAFSSQDLEMIVKCALQHGPHLFRRILHSVCPSIYGHELVKGALPRRVCSRDRTLALPRLVLSARPDGVTGTNECSPACLLALLAPWPARSLFSALFALHNQAEEQSVDFTPLQVLLTHEYSIVIAGITLSLFGGVQKHAQDKNRVPVRGDIHILVVGDPGLGKSQLLKSAASVAPRGVYVCGNSATSVGLTVAVMRDAATGDYAFEAAAGEKGKQPPTPLLAKQSFLALGSENLQQEGDENRPLTQRLKLDKDADAGFEALPPGLLRKYIAYARQHVVPRLSQEAREVMQKFYLQLREHSNAADGTPITARQLESLVRLAEARARLELRTEITRQDALLHAGARGGGAAAGEKGKQPPTPLLAKQSFLALGSENLQQEGDENRPLTQRLKLDKDADAGFEALPPGLLRKYIAYARQHVVPRLSQEAREVMQKFYLQLREHSNAADGTPITARQLESLVRLAEARARLELRTEITRQDALRLVRRGTV